jgi:hypothetical protein
MNKTKHRIIELTSASSKRDGKWLAHVYTTRSKRTLNIKLGTQAKHTGHKIAISSELQFQKSRFYEPGCLAIRFETPEQKERVKLVGRDRNGKEHTMVVEQVLRPKFWRSIILRREDVLAIMDFLTTETEQWLGPPSPSQHHEKFITYEELHEQR